VIVNIGKATAGASKTTVTGVGSFAIPPLGQGRSASHTFGCVSGVLTAVADASNSVHESNESNNARKAGPFACPAPDLVISKISPAGVTVTNIGTANAGPFQVSVSPSGSFSLGGLAAKRSFTRSFPVCVQGPVKATADSANQVAESSESNNSASGAFSCPDLVVSQVTSSLVLIKNIGGLAAGPSVLQVDPIGTFSVGSIGAGNTAKVKITCPVGAKLVAHADAKNQVFESNEKNNTLAGPPC
jgi:subtilase family serine protease